MLKSFIAVFIQFNEGLENKLKRAPLLGLAKSLYYHRARRVVIRSHSTQHSKQVKNASCHILTMQEPNLRQTLLCTTARIVALHVLTWNRKPNLLRPARSEFENVIFYNKKSNGIVPESSCNSFHNP